MNRRWSSRHLKGPCIFLASLLSAACGIIESEDALVVTGAVTLDQAPLQGASVRLVAVSQRRVSDTSIQGYHYEEVETPLASARTGADGRYRVEASRAECTEAGAFVEVGWESASAVLHLTSSCGEFAGRDAHLRTYEITGTVRMNGAPVGGTSVEWLEAQPCGLSQYGSPVFPCFPTYSSLAVGTTRSDGTYTLSYPGVECSPSQDFRLRTVIDGGEFGAGVVGCPGTQDVDIDASTLIELGGIVHLDGAPTEGWVGQIVGPAEPCNLFVQADCEETVLASAITDSEGRFEVQHLARGFQCQSIYLRAVPPSDWEGTPPIAENPPASGWERGCGSYPDVAFHFSSSG